MHCKNCAHTLHQEALYCRRCMQPAGSLPAHYRAENFDRVVAAARALRSGAAWRVELLRQCRQVEASLLDFATVSEEQAARDGALPQHRCIGRGLRQYREGLHALLALDASSPLDRLLHGIDLLEEANHLLNGGMDIIRQAAPDEVERDESVGTLIALLRAS